MECKQDNYGVEQYLKIVQSQGFEKIPAILKASFKELIHESETNQTDTRQIEKYFHIVQVLLYGTTIYSDIIALLARKQNDLVKQGVCAKILKAGDVAWKCEDCENDTTCIICQECFNNGDHKGHRVLLNTDVEGCCDCGDPYSWKVEGFCSQHKGFQAYQDLRFEDLPEYSHIKQSAPFCFNSLASQLKQILLQIQNNQNNSFALKNIVRQLILYLEEQSKQTPQNIYLVSKALTEIFFPPEFHLKTPGHICSFRYFINYEEQQNYQTNTEKIQNLHQLCSCSCLDILFQTAHIFCKSTNKALLSLIFVLFQSHEFKQALAMTYISNIEKLLQSVQANKRKEEDFSSLISLGVQVLTIEQIVLQVIRSPELAKQIVEVNKHLWNKVVLNPHNSLYKWQTIRLAQDLKYMCKPSTVQVILNETTIIDQLIFNMAAFHFKDVTKCPTEVEDFDNYTDQTLQNVQMVNQLESMIQKYLQHVQNIQDTIRILAVFEKQLINLNQQRLNNYRGMGFVLIPLVRLLAYFLTRLKLTSLINNSEFLLDKELAINTLGILSAQNGFISEVKANIWIYKGEYFQIISAFQDEQLKGCLFPDIGLLQVIFGLSPSYIDEYIKGFGTNQPTAPLLTFLSRILEQRVSLNQAVQSLGPKVQIKKLGLLIQCLLLKIVQVCILESSITYSSKNLFASESHLAQLQQIKKKILVKELMHNLFVHGAATKIDKIVNSSDNMYTKNEAFVTTLTEISNVLIDANGKKTFKLKKEFLSIFDPFYYVDKKLFKMVNGAYNHVKLDPEINNFVGDFKRNYKYATDLNQQIWKQLGKSNFRYFITMIVKEFLHKSQCIETQLITFQSFISALKLQIFICEQMEDQDYLSYLKIELPVHVLQMQDEKLSNILCHLSGLIHDGDSIMKQSFTKKQLNDNNTLARQPTSDFLNCENRSVIDTKVANSREQMLKKQKEIMQQMKAKQSIFLISVEPRINTKIEEKIIDKPEETPIQNEIQCVSCQEIMTQETKQNFVQLGYVARTKLLFRTCVQTVQEKNEQFQSLRNILYQSSTQETKNQETPLEELKQQEIKLAGELGLDGIVDSHTLCGVQLNRCCHFFHANCLSEYIASERKKSYQQQFLHKLLGMDDNMIQCPLCKSISNIYQPLQPITSQVTDLTAHINFISMTLTSCQQNPKPIQEKDIANDPVSFVQQLMQFTTHIILSLTTYRQDEMYKMYDVSGPSSFFTLRDIVFVLKSGFAIVERVQSFISLEEIAEILLLNIQNNLLELQICQNHEKIAVEYIFCNAIKSGPALLMQTALNAVYETFKLQVIATMVFSRQGSLDEQQKQLEFNLNQIIMDLPSQEVVSLQLKFLRSCSLIKIVTEALKSESEDVQLGINSQQLIHLGQNKDDLIEFQTLAQFLTLRTSFETLLDRQNIFTQNQITQFSKEIAIYIKNNNRLPAAMSLLTSRSQFKFVTLPLDFQTLVRKYYQKQCRNCKKQLQNNAVCLICGEVLCLQPKDDCCSQLYGMKSRRTLDVKNGISDIVMEERELSYHARYWEGGCTIFLLPNTAQVLLVDLGRIVEIGSFYRTELGGQFSKSDPQNYENFFISGTTGGSQILERLRQQLINGEIPNRILQDRQRKGSAIRRHAY